MAACVPDAGDIIWLEFSSHGGQEQEGHCVLSPATFNRIGLMLRRSLITKRKDSISKAELSKS